MTNNELLAALRRLKVETGSLACLGCGHEHSCGIHGCAILREAAERLGRRMERRGSVMTYRDVCNEQAAV